MTGGLSWETTEDDVRAFFSKHAEVASVFLKLDQMTGRSRGFAFVLFKTEKAEDVISQAGGDNMFINGRRVEAKRANARQGKIFVGGVPHDVTDDEVERHFGQFGRIVSMEIPRDKVSDSSRYVGRIDYRCEDRKKVGEVRGDIGAIR